MTQPDKEKKDPHCMNLELNSIPGTSRLYRDYVNQKDLAVSLFGNAPFSQEGLTKIASDVLQSDYHRKELAAILARQNQNWGAAQEALDSCKKLEKKDCLAVVTGQQVGMLGGPLYSITKAIHAIKLAKEYEKLLKKPVVPIFWMELEDHDLEEINQVNVKSNGNKFEKIQLSLGKNEQRTPVNGIPLGESLPEFKKELRSLWPATEFTEDLMALINESYSTDGTFADGFAKLFAALLSRKGLILADPSEPALKKRVSSVFAKEISEPLTATTMFRDHDQLISSAQYHSQVTPTNDRLSLFLVDDNEKIRISKKGNIYSLGEPAEVMSGEDLLAVAESEPERFIPSVLLRPIVQDTLFPTIAYIAGPSEVAYFAQMKPAYEHFGVTMPMIIPRAGITLMGGNVKRSITKYSIEAQEIFQNADSLLKHILNEHVPGHAEVLFKMTRNEIGEAIDRLKRELDSGEGNFSQGVQTAKEKIDYHINKLQERYLKELEKKHEVVVRRIENLSMALYPAEKLQERVYSIAEFINQYGPGVMELMFDAVNPTSPSHKIIEV